MGEVIFYFVFFFFNDTATTEIYTLSLHDALPILASSWRKAPSTKVDVMVAGFTGTSTVHSMSNADRKSTRLNSSHVEISYAVFCLKKKKSREQVLRPNAHPTRLRSHRDLLLSVIT